MNKEESKPNTNAQIKEQLELAIRDLDALIEHFEHPSYNPAQCVVMKRVRVNINNISALLDEE